LREGLLWDLVGRLTDEDARDRSVRSFQQRFHVELAQAERVEATALALLRQLAGEWSLEDPECAELLGWAARLHEVGLDIAHAHHQLHAAYLLRMPTWRGFLSTSSAASRCWSAGHRRKIRDELLDGLQEPWSKRMPYLLAILRLAVLLHRSRSPAPPPPLEHRGDAPQAAAELSPGWLDSHPLTRADLEQEARYLAALDLKLSFR
jgi:exopolyphosphatase / guanosine-5'-triphosphate,3'-diphosphate pyrophosphatase